MTAPADPIKTLLELRDVVLPGTPDSPGLGPVHWRIATGEWWVLAGAPESGKSALLATAAGLRLPTRGIVEASLHAPHTPGTHDALATDRGATGFVFEGGARLLHRLSLVENVALPLQYHQNLRLDDALPRALELLAWVGLSEQAHATPGHLKPYQCQRAGLARALSASPELLLIDNPTAGLPLPEVHWWQRRLQELHAGQHPVAGRAVTLVLACDNPQPWWDLGTRFALLDGGSWIDLGDRTAAACRREEVNQKLLSRS